MDLPVVGPKVVGKNHIDHSYDQAEEDRKRETFLTSVRRQAEKIFFPNGTQGIYTIPEQRIPVRITGELKGVLDYVPDHEPSQKKLKAKDYYQIETSDVLSPMVTRTVRIGEVEEVQWVGTEKQGTYVIREVRMAVDLISRTRDGKKITIRRIGGGQVVEEEVEASTIKKG